MTAWCLANWIYWLSLKEKGGSTGVQPCQQSGRDCLDVKLIPVLLTGIPLDRYPKIQHQMCFAEAYHEGALACVLVFSPGEGQTGLTLLYGCEGTPGQLWESRAS